MDEVPPLRGNEARPLHVLVQEKKVQSGRFGRRFITATKAASAASAAAGGRQGGASKGVGHNSGDGCIAEERLGHRALRPTPEKPPFTRANLRADEAHEERQTSLKARGPLGAQQEAVGPVQGPTAAGNVAAGGAIGTTGTAVEVDPGARGSECGGESVVPCRRERIEPAKGGEVEVGDTAAEEPGQPVPVAEHVRVVLKSANVGG
mmetsp:Transcript_18236/g.41691  ORF Transcript_18236/g.41691 Transcript_18236/m.41691 type:complete len:206 (-) Transcript_18236:288-905(-)